VSGPFTGTGHLVRLALRRDRVFAPVWIAVFALMAYYTAAATLQVYPDIAALRPYSSQVNASPALVALYGPVWDVDSLASGAVYKISALGAALVAVLTMIMTVRHTRAEEDAGRLELLGAGVVGRLAGLTASVAVASATTVVLGLLSAAGLVAAGLPTTGSLAFGLSWIASGLAFVGVAAVTAQLASGARAATGLAASVLGVSYLLRAIGDAARPDGPTWVSWLSPVGWAEQIRPYGGDRFGVGLVGLAFAAATTAAAYALAVRRDLGAGLLADRPGPPVASPRLAGPFALALRLQRGVLIAWTVAFAVFGVVVGSLANSIESMADSPSAREAITTLGGMSGLVDAFFSVELGASALIGSIWLVQSVNRLRGEETAQHAEAMLATGVGRRRWVLAHVAVAAGGALWLLLVGGTTIGLSAAATLHDRSQFGRLFAAELWQAPAMLVLGGLTVAAFGLVPRFAAAGWGLLVAFLLLQEVGPLLKLSDWVLDVSPYRHTPRIGAFDAVPVVALAGVAVVLLAVGLESFRRRDVPA